MLQAKPFQIYVDALGEICTRSHFPKNLFISGATADSRLVSSGWIFCAIPGARQDGTDFVNQALKSGAAAIVSTRPVPVPANVGYAEVSDAYIATARIAEAAYDFPARKLKIIGVTGTNGKTTCAFLLQKILEQSACRTGMIGTVQYSLGKQTHEADRTTPMPFNYQKLLNEMIVTGLDSAVVEVSSHALVQRRIGTVPLAAALFTNLTGDHLDYHGTYENYYRAKKILFDDYLSAESPAVINCDDLYGKRLLQALKSAGRNAISYGIDGEADWQILDLSMSVSGASFNLRHQEKDYLLKTPMIGKHNVMNVAGAATLALSLGIAEETVKAAIADCCGAPGRLQRVNAATDFSAFVDYAHTDDALRNVLCALRELRPRRLLLVFGCGGDRDRTKRARMGKVAAELADYVVVTSDNPRGENPAGIIEEICKGISTSADCQKIEDRRLAICTAVQEAAEGDILLVAGKGHEKYQEINGCKYPFDDLEAVRQAIEFCNENKMTNE